jgi:hypothetical protein
MDLLDLADIDERREEHDEHERIPRPRPASARSSHPISKRIV